MRKKKNIKLIPHSKINNKFNNNINNYNYKPKIIDKKVIIHLNHQIKKIFIIQSIILLIQNKYLQN